MSAIECFRRCRSGVAQIRVVVNGELTGGGSGFLVEGGLVTNSHVVRAIPNAVLSIRFEGMAAATGIRIAVNDVVVAESPEAERDFALLRLNEPELAGRHRFALAGEPRVAVGCQVGFLGFPFTMGHLTCHLAHVSSVHETNGVRTIQLDGSVNAGNSGGPLVDCNDGAVVGIVTRAHTGLLESAFAELIEALRENQRVLAAAGGAGRMVITGVDPIAALGTSQAIMERIARDLRRSANVGIGYAFSSEYVREAMGAIRTAEE